MTQELMKEFQRLYHAEFGETLTDDDALERAQALLDLFRAIYRPIPIHKKDVYKNLEACYKEDIRTQP